MEKKYIIIIVLIILLIIGGLILFNNSYNKVLHVGEIKFIVPNEYKIDGLNVEGNPTISDGSNSIYFDYYNNTNIDKITRSYIDERESNNITIVQSNFTINNISVYKTDSSQGANHYWFLRDGKTYTIYTWKETSNIDSIVHKLVSSIN